MANSLIITVLMLTVSLLIGLFIRNKIWGQSNKLNNPLEYGRAFAAYISFFIPIVSIFLFIKKDLSVAVLSFSLSILSASLIAFICGFIYGQFKKPVNQNSVRLTSYALFVISFIVFLAGIKSLSDKHMFNFGALIRAEYDIGLVLASYLGALVIPVCFLFLGLGLHKNSRFKNIQSGINTSNKLIFNKSYLIGSIICIGFLLIVFFIFNFQNTHKSNWIPIIKTVFFNYTTEKFEGSTTYIDTKSFKMKEGFLYVDIGNEFENTRSSDLAKSTKQIIQVDCQVPKFRVTEVYTYKKSPLDGFGELLSSNLNLQASLAKLVIDNGGTYSGGWSTKASLIQDLVNQCDLPPSESRDFVTEKSLCDSTRRELAILNFVCGTK